MSLGEEGKKILGLLKPNKEGDKGVEIYGMAKEKKTHEKMGGGGDVTQRTEPRKRPVGRDPKSKKGEDTQQISIFSRVGDPEKKKVV